MINALLNKYNTFRWEIKKYGDGDCSAVGCLR